MPIFVQDYPYSSLSGISFENVEISVKGQDTLNKNSGALLFTHNSFSGPAVLNASRYAETKSKISINYFCGKTSFALISDMKKHLIGSKKSVQNFLTETFNLPARFSESVTNRLSLPGAAASLSKDDMSRIASLITSDTFSISGTGGFKEAMATAGGVNLCEIDLKTFESKKYPRLYIIGEALDVDGDTGGYNIQFAFSSGYTVSYV